MQSGDFICGKNNSNSDMTNILRLHYFSPQHQVIELTVYACLPTEFIICQAGCLVNDISRSTSNDITSEYQYSILKRKYICLLKTQLQYQLHSNLFLCFQVFPMLPTLQLTNKYMQTARTPFHYSRGTFLWLDD